MTAPTPEATLVAPTNLLAEVEAVRKIADVSAPYSGQTNSFVSNIVRDYNQCREHRALLLQALDGLMKGLGEDALAKAIATEQNRQFCATALELARAIRASLGLTQGSGTE